MFYGVYVYLLFGLRQNRVNINITVDCVQIDSDIRVAVDESIQFSYLQYNRLN